MENKSKVIYGTIVIVIVLVLVGASTPSVYTAGKDFGRTIYEVFSNRK